MRIYDLDHQDAYMALLEVQRYDEKLIVALIRLEIRVETEHRIDTSSGIVVPSSA